MTLKLINVGKANFKKTSLSENKHLETLGNDPLIELSI